MQQFTKAGNFFMGCNNNCGCSSRTLFTNNADVPLTAIMADATDWPAPEPGSGFMPVLLSKDGTTMSILSQNHDRSQPARWVKVKFVVDDGIKPLELGV